jgi:hypothetical protein
MVSSVPAYGQILDRVSRSVKILSVRIALWTIVAFWLSFRKCVRVPISRLPPLVWCDIMRKIDALRAITTKPELALLLGVKASFLTYVLYKLQPSSKYSSFTILKKSGGTRTIFAPSDRLKTLQLSLSNFLQDCIEEINKSKGDGY